ncbi:hypothetical protein [Serratia fonticola]|uniref:hypothetical protein n=1 Tax=Serratia fonticola TaxID=47917 RepID=UPI0027EFED64|nr:hypothetical protein [Serratia fonticola]MDQ7207382.1 hypothetical protein [Serratia fonticola]HBE9077616.1 hypothetical protein [Serratia fonticola]HBE9088187.1 hypothetical protein [Serratia fonticola]HBE9150345.1 hypothetical protein [Serratia fonticola]
MFNIIVVKHKPQISIGPSADRLHLVIDRTEQECDYQTSDSMPEDYRSVAIPIEEIPALIDALKIAYEKTKHFPTLDLEARFKYLI